MESKEKQKLYDSYIERPSPRAEAIGRKVPYHLEYARRHGYSESEAGKDGGHIHSRRSKGKGGTDSQRCDEGAAARGGAPHRILREPRRDELPLRGGLGGAGNRKAAGTGVYSRRPVQPEGRHVISDKRVNGEVEGMGRVPLPGPA